MLVDGHEIQPEESVNRALLRELKVRQERRDENTQGEVVTANNVKVGLVRPLVANEVDIPARKKSETRVTKAEAGILPFMAQ